MKNGGTPLHWASSREVLESLIQRGCYINSLDFNGRTALHVMVSKNRLECVVSLLAHEADIDVRDKDGNTPLHIAVEKKLIPIVQCLVVFGCDVDSKNKNQQSSRHMVGKDPSGTNDDMILYILHSVGAKRCPETSNKCPPGCNFKGTTNGIPPAQPESTEQREHITQMLASTSSQHNRGRPSLPNIINQQLSRLPKDQPTLIDTSAEQKGASVMDALLGMFTSKIQAASKEVSFVDKGTSTIEDEDDVKMAEDNDAEERVEYQTETIAGRGRLLCLDGGGIRGIVLAQMLLEVETLAQCPINHLFDWIAGTSTGGILALGIGSGKTMKQCMCLYLRMKDSAFVGSRPYPSEYLENVLKENLGEHTVMSEISHPKIMVTAVMADRKPVDLHLFKNYLL
jgi:calcium-independent phospholipase A2